MSVEQLLRQRRASASTRRAASRGSPLIIAITFSTEALDESRLRHRNKSPHYTRMRQEHADQATITSSSHRRRSITSPNDGLMQMTAAAPAFRRTLGARVFTALSGESVSAARTALR